MPRAHSHIFAIDPVIGALSFIAPPAFAAPGVANGDNIYENEVLATDLGLSDTQTIQIAVTKAPLRQVFDGKAGGDRAVSRIAHGRRAHASRYHRRKPCGDERRILRRLNRDTSRRSHAAQMARVSKQTLEVEFLCHRAIMP
jgi:hypothetical protein